MRYTARPMKILLDYLPILLFAGAYYLRDIYVATVVLIVSLFAQVAMLWIMTRRLPKVQLVTAMLALGLGGVTLALHDPTFIKLKPTILYALFALVLLGSQFIGGKPLIQRMLGSNLHLPGPVWKRLNVMWAGFFVFCGILNLYVAYRFSEAAWVNFKLFGMFGLTFAFIVLQGLYLSRHLDEGRA
jgi:intracellular septation protein